jgi:chemotaxis protein MotA
MKLSIGSITGASIGVALIIGAVILGSSNYMAFLNLEGAMIVIGGSLAVAFMSFQATHVVEALKGIGFMFQNADVTHENMHDNVVQIISWARAAKKGGLQGLEHELESHNLNDPFIKYGLNMAISNYTPADVRVMMETAAEASYERDTIPATVLNSMASHAPAFGMVGTLVGMVIMLGNLQGDMSGIGSGLAVSLLATLYGVVTARMLYMPAAEQILQKQGVLNFRNHLIIEGLTMLVENKSPSYIQDRLNSFLKPGNHYSYNSAEA